MEVFETLEKIDQLKRILEQVSYTLYFQPTEAINVVGVDTIDDLSIEIQSKISMISNPPAPTPS